MNTFVSGVRDNARGIEFNCCNRTIRIGILKSFYRHGLVQYLHPDVTISQLRVLCLAIAIRRNK